MLRKIPLLRLLIPYLLGILYSLYLPVNIKLFLIIGLTVSVVCGVFTFLRNSFRYRYVYGVAIHVCLFLFGTLFTQYKYTQEDFYPNTDLQQQNNYLFRILKPPKINERSLVVKCEVFDAYTHDQFRAIVYLPVIDSLKALSYGDMLMAQASFNNIPPPMNPGEFNYKRYVSYEGFHYKTYLKNDHFKLLPHKTGNIFKQWAAGLRGNMLQLMHQSGLAGQEFAVAAALLLGYESEISDDMSSAYAATGALHVLSVSGMHVAIIYAALVFLLGFLDRFKKGTFIKYSIIFLLIWCYAFITGLSPSVLRATTMFSFILCAQAFGLQTSIYNTLAASAFLLLLIDPLLIMQVGFQLSYLAVIGIVALYEPIYEKLSFDNVILDKAWAIVCVSIAAQLTTFPISLLYFHQFPVYFLFSNLLVIPVSSFVMGAGALSLIFSFYQPLALFFGAISVWLTKLLNAMVVFIQKLPLALIHKIYINEIQAVLIYVAMIFCILFLFEKRKYLLTATLFTLIGLTTTSIYVRYQNNSRSQLVVYHIPRASAIDIIDGRTVFEFKGTKPRLDSAQQDYFLDRYRNSISINNLIQLNTHPFYQFKDKRIGWLDTNDVRVFSSPLHLDYIILSNNVNVKIKDILKNYFFTKVIIDCSNKRYWVDKWMKECDELKIAYHNVKSDGAFVLNQ